MTEVYGFTGTRKGMTAAQRKAVRGLLQSARELHHGDCIGSDADAHMAAQIINERTREERLYAFRKHGLGTLTGAEQPQITLHTHPPEDNEYRAYMKAHLEHPVKPYLERNRDIVNAIPQGGKLIATPKQLFHLEYKGGRRPAGAARSGTWYTVRYALEHGKTVVIIWPDGLTEEVTHANSRDYGPQG